MMDKAIRDFQKQFDYKPVVENGENIKEAISFHLESLKEDGLPIPEPATICEYIEAEFGVTSFSMYSIYPTEIIQYSPDCFLAF